jgi:hypothetical protein
MGRLMKSGYSTSILVHKEGIMTNEELAKSISKEVNKRENHAIYKSLAQIFIVIIGMCMMIYPFGQSNKVDSNVPLLVGIFLGVCLIYFVVMWESKIIKEKIKLRDYIWDLVRADERKRCMTKMERYESEGSR